MMKKMNLPNKLTIVRLIFTVIIAFIMLFPFQLIGIDIPGDIAIKASDSKIICFISIRNLIAGVFFLIAALTDFLDGYIARKYNLVSDLGKTLDAIADKALVNVALICFASTGYLSPAIPVIIVFRDVIVDALKMQSASKGKVVAAISSGKIKTAAMLTALTLKFFSNLPFELFIPGLVDIIVYFATFMSLYSMVEYIVKLKKHL